LKIYMTMSKISNGIGSHLTTAYLKGTFSGDMTGPNPTDRRGKFETKRHVITDKKGIPLSVIITAAANTHMI
jgi:IS5 family transposase